MRFMLPSLRRSRRERPLRFELLEDRLALSASIGALDHLASHNPEPMKKPAGSANPIGLTPSQVRSAYGFSNVTFGSVIGDGTGQTIAIVDAFNDPTIASDLAKFDQTFGLPDPPNFAVLKQHNGKKLPKDNRGWSQEIALDVEWAHAIAPGANILLVEALSASELGSAVNFARNAPGVSVVSISAAGKEFKSEAATDALFTTPFGHSGVTFVVAAGDEGAKPEYPSSSPNVLTVGGTSLSLGWNGQWYRGNETVWSGGGGGVSQFEGVPSYQSGLGLSARGTPDVSYDGDPNTGFAVYDSFGSGGWAQFGGTSAGAPQWAALIAIADQGRALNGMGPLANAQAALYSVPRSDFFDVTSGSNGTFATFGYDTASGLGSPIADLLIPDLAAYIGSTNFTVASLPPAVKHGKSKAGTPKARVSAPADPSSGTTVDSLASAWATQDLFARDSSSIWDHSELAVGVTRFAAPSAADNIWSASPRSRGGRRYARSERQAVVAADSTSFAGFDAYFANLTAAVPIATPIN
jgi:subtilase family serine protease